MEALKYFEKRLESNSMLKSWIDGITDYYIEIFGSILFLLAIIVRRFSIRRFGYGVTYNDFVDGVFSGADLVLVGGICVAFFVLFISFIQLINESKRVRNTQNPFKVHSARLLLIGVICGIVWAVFQLRLVSQLGDFELISYIFGMVRLIVFVAAISYLIRHWNTHYSKGVLLIIAVFGLLDHFLISQSIALVALILVILGSRSAFVSRLVGMLVIINGVIASLQFVFQKSVGLAVIGESVLSNSIQGVAKIHIGDTTLIRGYGLMPHPNILSFFGVLGVLLMVDSISKQVDEYRGKSHTNSIVSAIASMWNSWSLADRLLIPVSLVFGIMCVSASFSRMGVVALLLMCGIYCFKHLSDSSRVGYLSSWVLAVSGFILLPIMTVVRGGSDTYRMLDINVWLETMSQLDWKQWVLGVGAGQYPHVLMNMYPHFDSWRWQPVHNVGLNIIAELGVVGVACVIVIFLIALRASSTSE